MSGIQVLHTNPGGVRMFIPSNVLDIANRLQKGDPTCGWPGDERLFVQFNQLTKKYEVWRACEDGRDRIISSWLPGEFDARVLKYSAEHDTRWTDINVILDRVDKHNESIERDKAREADAAIEEMRDFAGYAAKRLYLPGHDAPMPRPGV